MDLPDLVLLQVFSLFEINEQFGTLRLVSRKWKALVEFNLKTQRSLVVYEPYYPRKMRWPSDNRLFNRQEVSHRRLFCFLLASRGFTQIKKLCLYRIDRISIERDGLMPKLADLMCQTEELYIQMIDNYSKKEKRLEMEKFDWNFANLRVLCVQQEFTEKVRITAPRLEKLIIWDMADRFGKTSRNLMLLLSHPEKLKYLEFPEISSEMQIFANLEQLVSLLVKPDFHLSAHPKLKRLDLCLYTRLYSHLDRFEPNPIDALFEQRANLKLYHLKITNFGIEEQTRPTILRRDWLEIIDDISLLTFAGKDSVKNYSQFAVDRLPWMFCLRYPTRIQGHPHLSEWASKLNIKTLIVEHSNLLKTKFNINADLLIKFLVEIGGIDYLGLTNCSFGPEFYDQLNTVPYITKFWSERTPIHNFDFICGLRSTVKIHFEIFKTEKFNIDSLCSNLKKSQIKRFEFCVCPIFYTELKKNQSQIRLKSLEPYYLEAEFFDNLDDCVSALKSHEIWRNYLI